MYQIIISTRAKKDLKKLKKRNQKDLLLIKKLFEQMMFNGSSAVPKKMKPHKLSGNFKNTMECHIKPDLLLIWFEFSKDKEINIVRVGSHSELF